MLALSHLRVTERAREVAHGSHRGLSHPGISLNPSAKPQSPSPRHLLVSLSRAPVSKHLATPLHSYLGPYPATPGRAKVAARRWLTIKTQKGEKPSLTGCDTNQYSLPKRSPEAPGLSKLQRSQDQTHTELDADKSRQTTPSYIARVPEGNSRKTVRVTRLRQPTLHTRAS